MTAEEHTKVWNAAVNNTVKCVLEVIDSCKFDDDTELNPYDGIIWHNKALEIAKKKIMSLKGGEC